MVMNKTLSVIIPVYNVAEYLPKCIESVQKQTYSDLQVILVDDGSTDESGVICDQYQVLDNRISVIHKMNGGLSSARNAGLNLASGEFNAFLDSDDWIEETMYEELIQLMYEYNADIASCGFKEVYKDKAIIRSNTGAVKIYNRTDSIKGLLKQNEIRFEVWNKVYKKEVIGDTRFKDKQVFEDIYFERCCFLKMHHLVYLDKALHNYLLERPGNTNSKFSKEKLLAFAEIDGFINELREKEMFDAADCIQAMAIQFSIGLYLQAQKLKVEKRMLDQLKHIYKKYDRESIHNPYVNRKITFLFNISPQLYAFVIKLRSK